MFTLSGIQMHVDSYIMFLVGHKGRTEDIWEVKKCPFKKFGEGKKLPYIFTSESLFSRCWNQIPEPSDDEYKIRRRKPLKALQGGT